MSQSAKQKPEPVGSHWLEELQRLFADEFPESQCEAQRAIESAGSERVPDNRYRED